MWWPTFRRLCTRCWRPASVSLRRAGGACRAGLMWRTHNGTLKANEETRRLLITTCPCGSEKPTGSQNLATRGSRDQPAPRKASPRALNTPSHPRATGSQTAGQASSAMMALWTPEKSKTALAFTFHRLIEQKPDVLPAHFATPILDGLYSFALSVAAWKMAAWAFFPSHVGRCPRLTLLCSRLRCPMLVSFH